MIGSIAVLLLLQLAGTLLAQFLRIPVPGPVLGMLILFAWLLWRGGVPQPLAHTATPILQNLSLLFVPAGVGIVPHWHELAGQSGRVVLVLALGAAATLLVTAYTLHWLIRLTQHADSR